LLPKHIILLNKSHVSYIVCLIKSLELLRRQQLSIMQQFGASAFYTVFVDINQVTWTLSVPHIILSSCLPKIIKFGEDLTKFWQKVSWDIFCIHWHLSNKDCHNTTISR